MKTAILTIALALASALSALAQTVMRENSTVYFQTNVFLHDDPTNPLHQRISVEGKEPLWVAASNQVVYYQSSAMTNASIHARYLYSTNATLSNANIHATVLRADLLNPTYISPSTTAYGMRWQGDAGIHNKFGKDGGIFYASPYNSSAWYIMNTTTQHLWAVGLGGIVSNAITFTKDGLGMTNPFRINTTNLDVGVLESAATMRLTSGLTVTASDTPAATNTISATATSQHIQLKAGDGAGSGFNGGQVLLTPGSRFGEPSRVRVTAGKFDADYILTQKLGLTKTGPPGIETAGVWLASDGTNLYFVVGTVTNVVTITPL